MLGTKKKDPNKKYENNTILKEETAFNIKEAYKAARTNIMFAIPGEGCKRIVVSSSYPGEGKTTTTINLAITFAQTGARVMIIDCDMRKPRMRTVLSLDKSEGLSNVLGGFCELDTVISETAHENLHAIGAGQIPPNPAELLASKKMGEVLDQLSESYDYIFLDTPPVNVVTDATVLTPVTDGTIMVTRHCVTTHKDIQESLAKLNLANAKVLGLILSGIKQPKGMRYGKYARYGKYDYTYQYGDAL